MAVTQRADYTFKYNKKLGRHGWLRLTPAYSVKLVEEIIRHIPKDSFILDPFSGTATTGLVAAEHGITSHGFDINPFLVWFGNAKCRNYTHEELTTLQKTVKKILIEVEALVSQENWVPNIHNITRWWNTHTLKILAALRQSIVNHFGEIRNDHISSLAWIAFCRLVIETSSAAFNHVSMSFQEKTELFEIKQVQNLYLEIVELIILSASSEISHSSSVFLVDARDIDAKNDVQYSHVVTSPPYPNRISYIRELRPYMYWTKFIDEAKEAGELDWKAIGGTWGIATSRLKKWEVNGVILPDIVIENSTKILETNQKNSLLMANYVLKYFYDMHLHFQNLQDSLQQGAVLSYIVGNSSFYGVQVHAEELLKSSLLSLGFTNVGSKIIRKRNSKKELFEYCVFATWNETKEYIPSFFVEKAKQPSLF